MPSKILVKKLMLFVAALASFLVFTINTTHVGALETTDRSLTLGTSAASAVTSYTHEFNVPTNSAIGSIEILYCSNSPLSGDVCTPPAGFSAAGTSVSAQSGITGLSVNGGLSTANRVVLTRAASVVGPIVGNSFTLSNVTNPNSVGTYFARVATFVAIDATGAAVDEGSVAVATTNGVGFTVFVPPVLDFCVAVQITSSDCTTLLGNAIDFGEFNSASTNTGTLQFMGATNGNGGYNIVMTGTTMTSGNNIIPGLAVPTASAVGTSQFGMNVRANNNPSVGQSITGIGTGFAGPGYGNVDQFKFVNGDTVGRALLPTNYNKYTASYIVNIDDDQAPGFYTTTLTFIATATF